MKECNDENRFNHRAGRWHALGWVLLIVLLCLAWSMSCTSCGTSKKTESSHVSVMERQDSVNHERESSSDKMTSRDSSYIKESENNHRVSERQSNSDSVYLSETIEKETVIRMGADGKEVGRDTHTTITRNHEHTSASEKNTLIVDSLKNIIERNNHEIEEMQKAMMESIYNQSKVNKQEENESKVEKKVPWYGEHPVISILFWIFAFWMGYYLVRIILSVVQVIRNCNGKTKES